MVKMAKFKVGFDFKDAMEIEAKDEDEAIEIFSLTYEDKIARNNETLENKLWETVSVRKKSSIR